MQRILNEVSDEIEVEIQEKDERISSLEETVKKMREELEKEKRKSAFVQNELETTQEAFQEVLDQQGIFSFFFLFFFQKSNFLF